MVDWRQKLAKYFKVGPYGVAASAIIAGSVIFRVLLLAFNYPEVNSDEGTMGIEAMHIAFQGQHPIYLYGQDYMGVLEAYIAVPFFHLFGVSEFTLRIGMLIMYALFMLAMYWLSSLLYTKRLALVTLILLSLGTADMLVQQLRAVGGAIETILFGALMLILAYRLALTAGQRQRGRYLEYAAWGFTVGIALWVHFLVLPFVLCSGLLILVFCYREWKTPAIPYLLLGLLTGGFLLIPGYRVFATILNIRSGAAAGVHASQGQDVFSTVVWGIPLTTGFQPICAVTDLPSYGPRTALTVPCTVLQGTWGIGYIILLAIGLSTAAVTCWRLWKQCFLQKQPWSGEERQQAALHFARLMHLLTAVLVILLYASSPLSGAKPWSTRYLVGLLVATPGILWPLWKRSGLEKLRVLFSRTARWCSRVALVLLMLVTLAGTIYTVTTVPAANADAQQQQQLVTDLLKLKVTRVYLEYWTCYRMLFQGQEKVLCARPPYPSFVVGADRYEPDAATVHAAFNVPFMFPATPDGYKEMAAFEQYNRVHGLHFRKYDLDGMILYIPSTS